MTDGLTEAWKNITTEAGISKSDLEACYQHHTRVIQEQDATIAQLRARVAELENFVTLMGDHAVVDWDDATVGRCAEVVKTPPDSYRDWARRVIKDAADACQLRDRAEELELILWGITRAWYSRPSIVEHRGNYYVATEEKYLAYKIEGEAPCIPKLTAEAAGVLRSAREQESTRARKQEG